MAYIIPDNDARLDAPYQRRMDRETEDEDDRCYRCGAVAFTSRYPDSREVRKCDRCLRPICGDCAEKDYDCVGDPPMYQLTQWVCEGGCR